MPQPYRKTGTVSIRPEVLLSAPGYATLVMEIIAEFARTDVYLGFIASRLISEQSSTAFKIYQSMQSKGLRYEALQIAASDHLSADKSQVLAELLSRAKSCSKTRNRLAHGVWAVASDAKKGPIVYDVDEVTDWASAFSADPMSDLTNLLNGYVYSPEDLQRELSSNQELNRDLAIFWTTELPR